MDIDAKNRIGIFCLYNDQGNVEDYVLYLLQNLKTCVDRIIIVCNGKLSSTGAEKLKLYSNEIVIRKNEGYDAGAWKEIILDYMGREEFLRYDELMLLNDTFYGPLYSFDSVFEKMKHIPEVDFWGITIHGTLKNPWRNVLSDEMLPEHLQSYFLVIRKRLLHSKEFFEFWKTRKIAKSYAEAVCYNEVQFTKYFYDLGYKYAAYCDTRIEEKNNSAKINHYLFNARMLLEKYKCPVLKKKLLRISKDTELTFNLGDEAKFCVEYIRNYTDYDTRLIFDDLLKNCNVFEIKENLGLNYILPLNKIKNETISNQKNVLVVAHLYYSDLFEYAFNYLKNIAHCADLLITTDEDSKIVEIEKIFRPAFMNKLKIVKVKKRGRDMAGMLVGAREIIKKYDYFCFIHDKKSIRDGQAITVGNAFSNLLWDNVLASEGYVENILSCFEREDQLGFLSVPPPYHGPYYAVSYNLWASAYEPAVELAKKLGIKASIEYSYPPIAIGTAFWCRTKALNTLLEKNWKYEDFPAEPMPDDGTVNHALERIFPYVAQDAGYYSGVVINEHYAAVEIENLKHLLREQREALISIISISAINSQNNVLKKLLKRCLPSRMWELLRSIKHKFIG